MKVQSYWSHTFLPELIRRDGVVFDFGSNNGGFCKLVAPLCHRVICLEPDPHWKDRGILHPENAVVFHKALAAKRGVVRLNLNPKTCSSMHYADTDSRLVEVQAITLADATALMPSERIELIKMDIEGEEVAVLRDAPNEILLKVAQLTVEFHDFLDPASTPAIIAVIKRMQSLGFHAIRFSWHSYGDLLFVNQRLERLSLWQRADLLIVHKYGRGFGRIAHRILQNANSLVR